MTTNRTTATTNQTWNKVSAGHYRTTDNQFEAIKESDNTGWSLWEGSRRAAFLGTYKQCREEVASYAAPTATKAAPTPGMTTVTHSDGTVSRRTSKTRVYTHAVEVSPASAAAYAAHLIRQADEYDAQAATYAGAADNASVAIIDRHLSRHEGDDLWSYQATLRGTDRKVYTWSSADGRTQVGDRVVPVAEYLVDSARERAAYHQRNAARFRAEAAEVLAAGVPVGEFHVVRWSSRADLAAKSLGEFDYAIQRGCAVRVVPVD